MTSTLTFDAGVLARGWLATHLATGSDEDVPVIFGTLFIESYVDGVRLTATDRYMLLSAWVPCTNAIDMPEPPLDEAPDTTTVVRDPDGRGKALLTYLRKLAAKANKDGVPAPLVSVHVGVPADEGDVAGFPGMELDTVVIDYPDHERVVLPTVNGTFPDYRALLVGHTRKRTDAISLGAENMARLGQVAKIVGGFVRCTLAGIKGPIGVEIGVAPTVRGVVMPIAVAEVKAVLQDGSGLLTDNEDEPRATGTDN